MGIASNGAIGKIFTRVKCAAKMKCVAHASVNPAVVCGGDSCTRQRPRHDDEQPYSFRRCALRWHEPSWHKNNFLGLTCNPANINATWASVQGAGWFQCSGKGFLSAQVVVLIPTKRYSGHWWSPNSEKTGFLSPASSP